MQDSLGFLNLSLNEMIPFDGEPVALGTPTFEGEEGKEFLHNSPILLNQFSLEADHLGTCPKSQMIRKKLFFGFTKSTQS